MSPRLPPGRAADPVAAFRAALEQDGADPKTVRAYGNAVAQALRRWPKEPWKVLESPLLARESKRAYRAALRRWAEFKGDAALADLLASRTVRKLLSRRLAIVQSQRTALTTADVDKVLGMLRGWKSDPDRPRWASPALSLMIKLGLRAGVDLVWIQRAAIEDSLRAKSKELSIWSKRLKLRAVPTAPVLEELAALAAIPGWIILADLISPRAPEESRPAAAYGAVRLLLKEAAEEAGVDPAVAKTHAFRHVAALRVWEKTQDILKVRDFLGHSSITTTQVYLDKGRTAEIGEDLKGMYEEEKR